MKNTNLFFKMGILFFVILAILSYFYFDKIIAEFFHTHIIGKIKHYIKIFSKLGQAEYYLIPSIILYFIYKNKNEFIKKASLLIFASVAVSGILVDIIKIIVARYRPPAFFSDNLYGFKGFDIGFLVNSFPSGHSATALSAGVALMYIFPKYKYLFLFIAILIAFSRIFLAVHYFSDIIIGSLIGALTSIYLYNKIFKEKDEVRL